MPNPIYVPAELLDIFKSFATIVIDGKTYKNYFETSWDQVICLDGLSLEQYLKQIFGEEGLPVPISEILEDIETRIVALEELMAVLTGDDTIEGSIAYLIKQHNDSIEAHPKLVDSKQDKLISVQKSISILNWKELIDKEYANYFIEYVIDELDASGEYIATLTPTLASYSIVKEAEVLPVIEMINNRLFLYCMNLPTDQIIYNCTFNVKKEPITPTDPDITDPDVTDPDTTDPDVTDPDITDPDVTDPDITDPDVTDPDTTDPDVTDPDVTDPDTTDPDVTDPDITDPDVTDPDTTDPDVTDPDITDPDTTDPDVTDPDTTDPDVTDPDVNP